MLYLKLIFGEWHALLAGLIVLAVLTLLLLGCTTPKLAKRPVVAPIATVNEYGEVWRYSVSPEGHEQWQYVGLLADRIDLDSTAHPDRIRL